jgi:hypothetical protein
MGQDFWPDARVRSGSGQQKNMQGFFQLGLNPA